MLVMGVAQENLIDKNDFVFIASRHSVHAFTYLYESVESKKRQDNGIASEMLRFHLPGEGFVDEGTHTHRVFLWSQLVQNLR